MSYILDALKKASEQRGESAPGFRRFVSSPPVPGENRRAWAWRGVLAMGAAAVGAIAFVALRTAPDVIVTAPPRAAVVAPAPAEAPRAPAEAPRAPAEAPRAPAAASPPPRVVAPLISIPRVETPPRATPARRLPAVAVTPPRTHPPVAPPMHVPASSPMPVLAPSAPAVPVPAASVDPKLKLEVLVYSDVATERMVFINGRKYVQGDTVADRARVEEIQPDGVVLSEQGRRFTLRQ
jgi:type II secretion system (T2SS) protein B